MGDRFSHTPGVVKNGDNGDIACDSYHRYKEDAALMRRLNLNVYRCSIAWPRFQPSRSGPVNRKGLDRYKRVTDAILEANVRPLVTLYHSATHVINLAHCESFRLLKSIKPALHVGSMYDVSPMYPASDSVADRPVKSWWNISPPL